MDNSHILILKSFDELKFSLGKKTLIDFLKGNPNPTIDRNNLDELNSFGTLFRLDENQIEDLIDKLIKFKYLEIDLIKGKFKVLSRTNQGRKEIFEKKFKPNQNKEIKLDNVFTKETIITENDKKLFSNFDFFLKGFNDGQKKGIISNSKNILCIAGAGTGKTTVLTKKIEFLTKFSGVKEEEILAITFTKKSKEEMIKRLNENGILNSKIETFNSFCEKILKKKGDKVYGKKVNVLKYSDKIIFMRRKMDEYLDSQTQMLIRRGEPADDISDAKITKMFFARLQKVERWLEQKPNLYVLYINYNAVLKNPGDGIQEISRFLGNRLNTQSISHVIDNTLYRQRK